MNALTLLSLLFACSEKEAKTQPPAPQKVETPSPKGTQNVVMLAPSTAQVATWKGGTLSYGDFTNEMMAEIKQKEATYLNERYTFERGALENKILESVLGQEAKEQGLTDIDALIKKEVHDKIADPTDAEIEEFYNKVKSQTNGATLESIREQLVMSLKNQQSQDKVMGYIDGVKTKYEIKINLPFPDAARVEVSADDDPFLGPKEAPITIIQFAEYQCPYCGKAGESVDQVMKEYEGKIKMVYRDFPLSFHDRAIPAAVAANCSGDQGKYWEMHNLLMGNQRALSESDLTAHATSLSLDLDKWNECRKDPKQSAEVNKDFEDGQKVGVTGTPAFFVNGVMLSGAVPFAQFKEIIDRELGL
jgi:protein-disulfide isomerase